MNFAKKNFQLFHGDAWEALRDVPANSVDALVTDPPAGIAFMGKEWDDDKGGRDEWVTWLTSVMRQAYRALKPGAHGFVWALPRTSHWTATALENAGFEIRDIVTHLFGSGFPKSLDISKAIDKAAGAKPIDVGPHRSIQGKGSIFNSEFSNEKGPRETKPATAAAAAAWQGWGTALKPASEHWILIRKPCSEKTVAANVLKWGTGAINVDAGRIAASDQAKLEKNWDRPQSSAAKGNVSGGHGLGAVDLSDRKPQGRFPANLVLDEVAAGMLDAQSGTLKSGALKPYPRTNRSGFSGPMSEESSFEKKGDTGGASRFFYIAKTSTWERNSGLKGMPNRKFAQGGGASSAIKRGEDHYRNGEVPGGFNQVRDVKNHHPTVKPFKLMRYLTKLVTPPGGVVLDCFMGSGTTGAVAVACGFKFIGIEKDDEFFQIARKRIEDVKLKKKPKTAEQLSSSIIPHAT